MQIVGVDARFWRIGGAKDLLAGAASDEAAVHRPLAEHLGLAAGATGQRVVLRVPVPSGLPKDAPLAREKDAARGIPATVRAVADDTDFGRFSLRTNQVAPFTVFLPLATLQQKLNLPGKANVMLVPGDQVTAKAKQLSEQGYRVERLTQQDILPATLFASLRRADSAGADVILVTLPDEQGAGAAVADRLRKASVPRPTTRGCRIHAK